MGYTAKGIEDWGGSIGRVRVECAALPPYPGHEFPRVAGLLFPCDAPYEERLAIEYFVGDASEPRGDGSRIIAHVVNDATPKWGAGFAKVIRKKWPQVQEDFIQWASADRGRLRLGSYHTSAIDSSLAVFHMVAQHGFGPSASPRVRYAALETCLSALGDMARGRDATVHMPRIGCGQAGGNWTIVEELIDATLIQRGVPTAVYDLPAEHLSWHQRITTAKKVTNEKSLF